MASFVVVVTGAAQRDIDEAELWLVRNAGARAAATVIDTIADCLERLTTDALQGTPRPEFGAHMRFLQAPLYVVYYDAIDHQVTVIRILHRARDRDRIMRG